MGAVIRRAGLALLLAVTACADGTTAPGSGSDIASFTVERRNLRVTVSEKGSLKARQQILVRPQIPGQAKIMSLIEEGTRVKEGDILCELDDTAVEKEIDDLQNRVIGLTGEVKAAQAELEIQLSQNEADVADAKLQLRFAGVELERWEKGEFIQEKKKKEVRLEEALSEFDRATKKYDQMPALLEEGFVTPTQVEEERINKVKAQSGVELARLDQDTYLKYAAPKDRAQREADLHNAGLEVGRVAKRAHAREVQRSATLERRRGELRRVEARLAERIEIRENMVIRAPGPGIVIYGDARKPWDDREIRVGENVYSRQAFLTLPDLSEMQVVVAVHEADISRVKVGQSVFVTVETARGRVVKGEVTRVAVVADAARRRWSDDTKRFGVEISITGEIDGLEMKPGLTAQVEILVDELEGVLAVPTQGVFAESGKFFVFRRENGVVERSEVEIADGNSQYVVIKSGLEENDQVLLYNPNVISDAPAPGGGGAGPKKTGSGSSNGKP